MDSYLPAMAQAFLSISDRNVLIFLAKTLMDSHFLGRNSQFETHNTPMVVFPNAKINLGLHVVAKRADGFHNIESCFYPVGWTDILEIIPADTLQFNSSGIDIPGDPAHNLCIKAYQALKKDFDLPPVHIHLHKVIPIGAGLGGGSADSAFTVKLLNTKFDLGLTAEQMEAYMRPLGSDCAFFIQNKPLFCYEKGDCFENITIDLSGYFIVLVNPPIHVSTPVAYAGIKPAQPAIPLRETLAKPVSAWPQELVNDFEKTVFRQFPAIATIKEDLYKAGALYASMSGSGATVFGLFDLEQDLKSLFPADYLLWQGKLAFRQG
jgi:4-diphosphocytidyl-2-C-methyl-D-erythritol kinase